MNTHLPPRAPKILITGASGFIGGFLTREALRRGYEVWAGVRKTGRNRMDIAHKRIHLIDLLYDSPADLTHQLADFAQQHGAWDYVIHNAGLTKTPDKKEFFRVNAQFTANLVAALSAAGCRPVKFLLMSSLSSFGPGDDHSFRPLLLTDRQQPNTAYGQSKLLAEQCVQSQTDFPYIIFRPTGVYGPGERDYFMAIRGIRSGVDLAAGCVPQRITFIYVKDLATAAFLALEKPEIINRHYFVADGDVYTDREFTRIVQQILGKRRVLHARIPLWMVRLACVCSEWAGKLAGGRAMTLNTDKYLILKQRNWNCDAAPLWSDLQIAPLYPLRRGLEESIEWYRDQGWL